MKENPYTLSVFKDLLIGVCLGTIWRKCPEEFFNLAVFVAGYLVGRKLWSLWKGLHGKP